MCRSSHSFQVQSEVCLWQGSLVVCLNWTFRQFQCTLKSNPTGWCRTPFPGWNSISAGFQSAALLFKKQGCLFPRALYVKLYFFSLEVFRTLFLDCKFLQFWWNIASAPVSSGDVYYSFNCSLGTCYYTLGHIGLKICETITWEHAACFNQQVPKEFASGGCYVFPGSSSFRFQYFQFICKWTAHFTGRFQF